MQSGLVITRNELTSHSAEWSALLERSAANSIFLTHEWITTWLDVVAPDATVLFAWARDENGQLVGFAPFFRRRMNLAGFVPFETLQIAGGIDSGGEYPDLIVDRACEDAALAALARAIASDRDWDCIWCPYVAGWNGASERWSRLFQCIDMQAHERGAEFACVRLPDSHEALRQALPEKMRKHLKQYVRRLCNDGPWRFVDFVIEGQINEGYDALVALHTQRWSERDEAGAFTDQRRMAEFCRRFGKLATDRGWLRLFGMRDGARIGAVQLGYVYNGEFLAIQEGFDPSVQPPALGHVLRDASMQRCIAEGLKAYDFLGEYSDHKRRWNAERRTGCDLFAGRRSLKNRLLFTRPVWPTGRFLRAEAGATA